MTEPTEPTTQYASKNGASFLLSEQQIDEALKTLNYIRLSADKDKEFGFSDEFNLFIKKMLFLNPQSYGSRIQNYVAKSFNLGVVNQKNDKGDLRNSLNQHFEVKASLITHINPCLNLVQIRLWQKISGYFCVAIDTRETPFKTYVFFLTKNEMEIECANNASSAHGTQAAVENNMNKELRMSLVINPQNSLFQEWCRKYLQEDIDLRTI